jgi:hypothetical protein
MLKERLHEEVKELRAYIEVKKWIGLTRDEVYRIEYEVNNAVNSWDDSPHWKRVVDAIAAKLKEKNT